MIFKFVSFNNSVIEEAIKQSRSGQVLFILPNYKSKKKAIKLYQKEINFVGNNFLTMSEFKESLFEVSLPILKENKRYLALYASLTQEDKDFFRINSYFQSLEFTDNFFKFWEEINDELTTEQKIEKVLSSGEMMLNWQEKTYNRIIKIKKQYKRFLQSKHLTDKIFAFNKNYLNLKQLEYFKKIVVVNQFYYSRMEKYILNKISKVKVFIYYQINENYVDKQNLSIKKNIIPEDLNDILTDKLYIIESKDSFSMIASLFHKIYVQKISNIVDFNFSEKAYARFFNIDYFNINAEFHFAATSIYKILLQIYEIISSMITLPHKNLILIPIDIFFNSILNDTFIRYFIKENKENKIQKIKEKLREYSYYLIEEDYQYIDLDGKIMNNHNISEKAKNVIKNCFQFIRKIMGIKSLKNFINLFERDDGIVLQDILTKFELYNTDILDELYQIMVYFMSIEEINIVNNWDAYFIKRKNQPKNAAVITGIIKLFLDYLNEKKYKIKTNCKNKERINITSLANTRNLEYESLAILNVTEGMLPSTRKTQFLLSESQRMKLGFKTYKDINIREKYYFYRLIAQTKKIFIFTINNLAENIFKSSFLEEILIFFPPEKIIKEEFAFDNYSIIYKNFFNKTLINIPYKKGLISKKEFYFLPLIESIDCPEGTFILSPYDWMDLKRNPFLYNIKVLIGKNIRQTKDKQDFSPKLLGKLSHKLFAVLWRKMLFIHNKKDIKLNTKNIKQNIKEIVYRFLKYDSDFAYKAPHNYSEKYFRKIFLQILKDGLLQFFINLDKKTDLYNEKINKVSIENKLSPEQFYIIESNKTIEIHIKGIIDLYLELNKKYIIDYKSAKANYKNNKKYKNQLLFYTLILGVLKNHEQIENIIPYIYFIEDQSLSHYKISKGDVNDLKDDMEDLFLQIFSKGFYLPDRIDPYDIPEISRRDLYKSKVKNGK